MPELPEVETIRRGLHSRIIGKTISGAHNYDSPKSFPNATADITQFLQGATVTDVSRRAKVLLIELSTGYTLVTHLKMTGQIIFIAPITSRHSTDSNPVILSVSEESSSTLEDPSVKPQDDTRNVRWGGGHPSDSFMRELPDNTTREHIDFTDGSRLYFNDLRKFGWMKLYPTSEVPNIDFMKKVGPEPLLDDFTGEVLWERLQRRKNTSIKAAILDQTVLAGVGNIYADESLWGARIHPATLVKNVPKASILQLAEEIKAVMNLSIEKGGSTDKNYVNAEGKKGSYLSFARVFRREGEPCPRCGTTIVKTRVAGRGTHLCPTCQTKQ